MKIPSNLIAQLGALGGDLNSDSVPHFLVFLAESPVISHFSQRLSKASMYSFSSNMKENKEWPKDIITVVHY